MDEKKAKASRAGTLAAFAAYGMWGLFPLFWKQLSSVEPLQILMHRIIWAAGFCLLLMVAKGRLQEILGLFRNRKRFLLAILSSLMVTANWGLYIWAVNTGRVMESALGYYINPLLSVILGALFFKEETDRWTRAAVIVATASIVGAAIAYGSVPWVSILLGLSFAFYGALKKRLALEPLLGLTVETLVAVPVALAFLFARQAAGAGSYWNAGVYVTFLLTFSGIITAVPLLCFAAAANSITLQKMGFIQYVSPTSQLFLGLAVFGERPSPALIVAFAGVIIAVFLYVFSRKKAE
ncbi:MAG TPA: EamA family transporter RarD [Rectinemataceae bacterium]|nr:EamA family transporter RarD [Rectinemataceae bacterium]